MTTSHLTDNYLDFSPKGNEHWAKKFILFLEGVTAVFDGFKALDISALGILHNELRVVIGPNGAGKTTLCDVITGKTPAAGGDVYFDGKNITDWPDTDIAIQGIGRKFQTPTVYESLTTFENMELAFPGHQKLWNSLFGKTSREGRDKILSILERVHLLDQVETKAKYLSHGQRQWLCISSLILSDPKLLLIDEPAAGLSDSETELTARLLLELKKNHTLVVIEHDMDFVRQLNSRVTVLNEGQIMAEGTLEEVKQNEAVIEAYLGR